MSKHLFISILCLVLLSAIAIAQDLIVREGRIKAACVYHIVQFIEWPKQNIELKNEQEDKIKICTIGEDPLNIYLEDTLANKSKNSKTFEVKNLKIKNAADSISACSVVYFGEIDKNERLFYSKKIIHGKTLLIDSISLDQSPALISIYKSHNKIDINIKLEEAQKLGYKISSELLQIANIK